MRRSTLRRVSRLAILSAIIAVSAVEAPRAAGTGTLVYVTYRWSDEGTWAQPDGLALMHPDGSNQVQLTTGRADTQPAWSSDGFQIAFTRSLDIFVIPASGGTPVNLTNHPASDSAPAWSADGQRIAFVSNRGGPFELYVMNADGSGVARVTGNLAGISRPAWAPDGSRIAFNCIVDAGNEDICTVTVNGGSVTRLTTVPGRDSDAAWSPDGGTIAFATQMYGTVFYTGDGDVLPVAEIALMNPDGSAVRQLRAGMAAEYPSWSADGARIAFDVMEWFDWWMGPLMDVGVINADGSGAVTWPARGTSAAWRPAGGNLSPVALFTPSCTDHTCAFNAGFSADPDGSVVSYAWDFGDGTSGAGLTASHTYATRNPYPVKLTISDDSGAAASVTVVVELNVRPSANGWAICDGVACKFSASSWDMDGTIVTFRWTFGDGSSSAVQNPTHTYSTPGIYVVTLTVTDNEGATGTLVTNAAATKPPIASFTYTCGRLACGFDGSSSTDPDGSIASYEWYFGDGSSGTGAVVNHAYATAGVYGMSLTVRDNLGISTFIQKSVTVASTLSPIASFTSTCSFLACVFDGSASVAREGTLASYRWQFGDGNYGFSARESHTYALPGTYIVTLMVRDSYGVPHELSRTLTITATPAHIGDIDRVVTAQGPSWGTTVTLSAHAENHTPLASVRVTGVWSNGSVGECVTAADGRCAVQQGGLPKQTRSISFAVTSISGAAGYRPDRNHDPDSDSDGTTIVIKR